MKKRTLSHSPQTPRAFVTVTVVAAVTAAFAAAASLALSLPVWAMFVGWIAFFSRGLTTRSTFENLGCVWLGLGMGLTSSAVALAATGLMVVRYPTPASDDNSCKL